MPLIVEAGPACLLRGVRIQLVGPETEHLWHNPSYDQEKDGKQENFSGGAEMIKVRQRGNQHGDCADEKQDFTDSPSHCFPVFEELCQSQ